MSNHFDPRWYTPQELDRLLIRFKFMHVQAALLLIMAIVALCVFWSLPISPTDATEAQVDIQENGDGE